MTPMVTPPAQAMADATTISYAVNPNAVRNVWPSLMAAATTRLGAPNISGLRTPARYSTSHTAATVMVMTVRRDQADRDALTASAPRSGARCGCAAGRAFLN